MVYYFALERVQFVNLSCFDMLPEIIKIGINATSLVSNFEGDFLGVIGGGQAEDYFKAQDEGTAQVGRQL